MKLILFLVILWIFNGCSSQESSPPSFQVIALAARNEDISLERPLIYRVKKPLRWIQVEPKNNTSIIDTTLPIAEFFIPCEHAQVRVTIHNFPSSQSHDRIPPMAQISRWKKQFHNLDPTSVSTTPQAFGGYHGFLFEASGTINGLETTIMAWTLQLFSEHYRTLSRTVSSSLENRHRQMRGDVTIKVMGSSSDVQAHRHEIISFARSFQLMDDIL